MSKELSDKNFIVVVRNVGNIYVTKKEADMVSNSIIKDLKAVVIGDATIRVSAIDSVALARDVEAKDRKKRGDYQCDFGTWHLRNQICNCREAKSYGLL